MIVLPTGSVPHVARDPTLGALDVVLLSSILVIRHSDLGFALGVDLMLIDQPDEFAVLGDAARRCFHRSDHSLFIINPPMMMVARARLSATSSHHRRIRIAQAHHPIIHRFITRSRGRIL